ncbi:hypothetical protein [Chamaesiphon sp. VAR_48_metabat_403]|uniref:hypothetical protein n=1 Tax=Chamaesiphon sp. VAR_48_metabat_403 TaxID=2964700 RepID=UPI00286DBF9B|nr:hypothetical protein [Chamaesiphon sp. VAR_48_metabat_403]
MATLLLFDRLDPIYLLIARSHITMSKFSTIVLIGVGTIANTFLYSQVPADARLRKPKACVDPLPIAQRVELKLKADKKEMENNKPVFKPIAEKSSVKPGDIIKYTVIAKNNGRCPLKNLILKQPIPRGTNYLKDSAKAIDGAELLFSIDGGKTFSAQPKIGTEPAPTTAYNYLRWKFSGWMSTKKEVQTSYKLQVK